MMKILFFIFVICSQAIASPIEDALKVKDFKQVLNFYQQGKMDDYTKKELAIISYSFRKFKLYDQDILIIKKMVKKDHLAQHQQLMKAIKAKDSIDPEEYSRSLKTLYWNLFSDYGELIKAESNLSPSLYKYHKSFLHFGKVLSELEFREAKVDKIMDSVASHILYLKNKIYYFTKSWSLQYISWQQESFLKGSDGIRTGLVVTNKGYCLGGEIGIENYLYHFYFDGCFLTAKGNVKNFSNTGLNYQQSDISAYGVKAGPGVSVIISSSKSRIGIKIPIIYTVQDLQSPNDPNYKIEKTSPLSLVASLYSRWQFDKWYFHTEFGKFVQKDQTLWALGIGRNF